MKIEIDNIYMILLLRKNIWTDIIKIILEYPPIAVLEIPREWKVAIISVG